MFGGFLLVDLAEVCFCQASEFRAINDVAGNSIGQYAI
jgi:hypothetical protein